MLTQRHIRRDVLPDPVRQRALRRTMRSDARQQQLALASAVEQLRMANLLHNELEAVYRPCMDFAALTTFTDRYLRTFPGTRAQSTPAGRTRSRRGVRLQFSQQQGEKHGLQHRFSRHISAHQLPVPKPLFG